MPRGRRSPISPVARTFFSFLKTVTALHSPSCPHAVSLHFNLLTITAPSVFLPAPLFCHPELVVTRLCCQHFAVCQNARPARRLLLFPKISLRCDFREPCYNNPPSGEILRGAYQKTSAFTPPSASHDGESRRRSRRMRGVHFHVPPPLPSPHTSKRKPKTDDRPRAPHNTAPQFPFTPPLYPLFSGIFQSACQLFLFL